jgi:Flp pilus assembly protein TadB
MRRYESLRASDADRDAVTDRLHQAAVEGRLEPDELEERVHAALRARTYGELTPLVADLPPDGEVGWSHSRGAPLARVALVGAGLVAAIAVTIVVIAVVLLLLVAVATVAALTGICFVLGCLALRRTRRRASLGSAWHGDVAARHVRPPRATGFL